MRATEGVGLLPLERLLGNVAKAELHQLAHDVAIAIGPAVEQTVDLFLNDGAGRYAPQA